MAADIRFQKKVSDTQFHYCKICTKGVKLHCREVGLNSVNVELLRSATTTGEVIIMSEARTSSFAYILWTTLLGLIAFLISGLLSSVYILKTDDFIIGMLISGGVGALLLGLSLRLGKKILWMTVTGAFAFPLGLLLAFGVFGGLGSLLPASISSIFGTTGIADAMAIMLMSAIFAAAVGASIFGKKAIGLFFAVCAIAAIPFGILVAAFNSGADIKTELQLLLSALGEIDLNNLAITLAHGVGTGLSAGIYKKYRHHSTA